MQRRYSRVAVFGLLCTVLTACGGSGSSSDPTPPPPPPPPVTSAPPSATMPSFFYAEAATTKTISVDASDDISITRYNWEQTSGPSITISGGDTAEISIELPESAEASEIGLRATVFDAQNQSAEAATVLRVSPRIATAVPVTVSLPSSDVLDLIPDTDLVFISGRIATPLDDTRSLPAKLDEEDASFVAVANSFGTPILVSFKPSENNNIEVSLDTSAVAYVFKSPRFYGLEITDYEGLAQQIEEHPSYAPLVETLRERLQNSPCPMRIECNRLGGRFAAEIAQEIDIASFVLVGE